MENLGRDLGCLKTEYVERQNLNSTIWKQGIIFYWGPNEEHSSSSIGVNPGYMNELPRMDSIQQFGAYSTWQMIITNPDAENEAVLHHEVLHTLGFEHEHSRPDRDQYLTVNETFDSNYQKMGADEWFETKYPFEMQSVMIYVNSEKILKKNGQPVTKKSPRLTTTDALEVQEMYCTKNPNFELKEHVMCTQPDELGFYRPVFVDRICDGIIDCHDGSDEDESRFECLRPLNESCCDKYRLWDYSYENPMLIEYKNAGQVLNVTYYTGYNRFTKRIESLFHLKVPNEYDEVEHRWYIGGPENPNEVPFWMLGSKFIYSRDSARELCPPEGTKWSRAFNNRKVHLECVHEKRNVDYCSDAPCDINADCINQLNSYKCKCKYGFTGDGKFCTEIVKIDECHSRMHNCSENAICVDQRYGYTCACNDGFIDRDSARPGRNCESLVSSNGCCQEFSVFIAIANITDDELLVTCSIEDYSKFKFSPLRQSYKCTINEALLVAAKHEDFQIPDTEFNFAKLTKLYFEYDVNGWSCVDRDESMNLIKKYFVSGLESMMDEISYHNDLCFAGDFSTQYDQTMNEYLYGKCLHRTGSKKD